MCVRRDRWVLLFLLVAFAALCLWQAWWIPALEGDSEFAHYGYARFLRNTGQVPIPLTFAQLSTGNDLNHAQGFNPWHQTTQPPGYYVWVALATSWLGDADTEAGTTRPNFAHIAIDTRGLPYDNKNVDIHEYGPHAENIFPGHGYVLGVRLGRTVSVLLSLLTLLAAYFAARRLWPERPSFALLATAAFAAVPQFANTSSTLSNDSGVILWATLSIGWSLHMIRNGVSLWRASIAGLLCGATFSTNLMAHGC